MRADAVPLDVVDGGGSDIVKPDNSSVMRRDHTSDVRDATNDGGESSVTST